SAHTRIVNVKGEKISKSGGNVYTVSDALRTYSVNQLRMFLLNRHYRMDMDIRGIDSAAKAYNRLRGMAEKCRRAVGGASKEYDEEFLQHFCDAMNRSEEHTSELQSR